MADSDSDDSTGFLGDTAFTIEYNEEENFDLNLPPTSGNEYLRRVQEEAKQCPKVVVASIDRTAFQDNQNVKFRELSGCHPAPKGFAPTIEWQELQISNFSEVRQRLSRFNALQVEKNSGLEHDSKKIPLAADIEGWCRLCFGRLRPRSRVGYNSEMSESESNVEENGQVADSYSGTPPLLHVIFQMDQPTIIKVLEYHINWFEATGFSTGQGRWFYALLACLEKPLIPEACSLLRNLARTCASLRATLTNPVNPHLVPLNLLICLVAGYFGQCDLIDSER